ncbi:hypothetical protein F5884DRAFT_842772 [Xylogone sp. PMI_703]|nr:hypothetical protein F5884DRAFT_842772 [Xylogone sp. PMI_703]
MMLAEMQSMSSAEQAKSQVVDSVPKKFKELRFGIQSTQDIVSQAVIECSDRMLYDVDRNRTPVEHGVLDPRLGISTYGALCETCGEKLVQCSGHFGYVRLALPAFHIGYLRLVIMILQNICKDCARVLLTEEERRNFLKDLRRPNIDNLKRTQISTKINERCKKVRCCPYCGSICGQVRKVGVLKLIHDKYQKYNKSTTDTNPMPPTMVQFERSFDTARRYNPGRDLDKYMKRAAEDLNPLRVLNLFKLITPKDCELLGIDPSKARPEMFIWQYIPAPPVCIRPSVVHYNSSTEDDLTTKLADIVHMSSVIKEGLQKGLSLGTIMEHWEFMQLQVAMYINNNVAGLRHYDLGKPIMGFCQRLKGKQGRFRGNLSGKRVDFSGRTVISPDPNLSVEQVAIPQLRAFQHNIERLRERWPGANTIYNLGAENSRSLNFGDHVVERHIEDGDIILFNRQPSLHKLSIMAHYTKIQRSKTFRFNECVCGPYNADFDGDEMNIHIPQTEEARAEAINLMGVKDNLCSPKDGSIIISAIQDFVTASYLLSSKDRFFDRKTFGLSCTYMVNGDMHVDIPPPAIIKPKALWTGKQLFGVLMRPNKHSRVLVNLDARCRNYKKAPLGQAPDMDISDEWLVIRNSQVMCGRMDKNAVGAGKKQSIFYTIMREYGPGEAIQAMDRLTRLSSRFLTDQGFSIGTNDVMGSKNLNDQTCALVSVAFREVDDLIEQYQDGKLEKATGSGELCIDTLSSWNPGLIMAKSGSKGSNINLAQMVALVGQQVVSDARVADGFQDRTFPHFPRHAKEPLPKGFIRNSFFSGLTPLEYFFHAISGREGLIDTAVKTVETGYMSRRLMKCLEDLSIKYDHTVRTASNNIVQFQFSADKLDPVGMEGNAIPVNLDSAFTYAENLTWSNDDRALLPYEIMEHCDNILQLQKDKLDRRNILRCKTLKYNDGSPLYDVDENENSKIFIDTVRKFIYNLASKQASTRRAAELPELMVRPRQNDNPSNEEPAKLIHIECVTKVSEGALREFIKSCMTKYEKAQVVPGYAVGAIAAQSIGEPGTQMTLRTFHFAGVAEMSITEGVPRIKEIINASKVISTPVITCPLDNADDIVVARVIRARIEKTYISHVIHGIEDVWSPKEGAIYLRIDTQCLSKMHLDITTATIADAICEDRKLKIGQEIVQNGDDWIRVIVPCDTASMEPSDTGTARANPPISCRRFLRLNYLKRQIPRIVISGYEGATRALIETSEKGNTILVEGYGLRHCMSTEGIIGTKTTTNSIMEVLSVLGVEAARATIASEMTKVMRDMSIDPRHIELLADNMTFKGEVLGITRYGLSKMRDSVLQLASFEKTPDHLFEAAAGQKRDPIEGVTENIIMGQTVNVGTGVVGLVKDLGLKHGTDIKQLPTLFEDAWAWESKERKKITELNKM